MNVPPIPISALPSAMQVRVPRDGDYGGSYAEPVTVSNVRYDRSSRLLSRDYVLTDGASGVVFVDAANSPGAFEVPEGSLVSIDGGDEVAVIRCERFQPFGEVHHWELVVR